MAGLFKRALEEDSQAESLPIKIQGPMANVYADALAAAFAKRQGSVLPTEGEVAMESQAQDVTLMNTLLEKIQTGQLGAGSAQSPLTIYATSEPSLDNQQYVEVVDNLMESEQPENTIVLVTKVDPNANAQMDESGNTEAIDMAETPLARSLESLVTRLGGKYYTSLESLIKAR